MKTRHERTQGRDRAREMPGMNVLGWRRGPRWIVRGRAIGKLDSMAAVFKMTSSLMDPVRIGCGEGEGREDSGKSDDLHLCYSKANGLGF